jgi:hypothetical protein
MPRQRRISEPALACWKAFKSRHAGHPFLAYESLYALSEPIIDALRAEVPDFFTAAEVSFERDLARTASFGFFHGRALGFAEEPEDTHQPGLRQRQAESAQAIQAMLREEYRRDRVPEPQVEAYFQAAAARAEAAAARRAAYVGWLVTNRRFRSEVDALHVAWGGVVAELRQFPAQPRWPAYDLGADRAVPGDLTQAMLAFYRRWGLDQLLTWEWPVPMRPDLVGGLWKDADLLADAGVAVFVPWYLLRGDALDLQQLARHAREVDAPAHLRPWVNKARAGADELGDRRYERLAWLYRYMALALWRRYPDACRRRAGKLDRALSRVLERDEESVRKLRQQLQRLLPER